MCWGVRLQEASGRPTESTACCPCPLPQRLVLSICRDRFVQGNKQLGWAPLTKVPLGPPWADQGSGSQGGDSKPCVSVGPLGCRP